MKRRQIDDEEGLSDSQMWEVIAQTVRVLRDPAKYVRREDERARKLALRIRRKVNELADTILNR
ncbi:MAG: hypothetical protein GWO24_19205 [Akkermansiaceae bacterium]|nr:hypothetical protein [Akkermansiaceae bacterium]